MLKDLLYTVKLKIEEGSIASVKNKIGSEGAYIIPFYEPLLEYKVLLEEELYNISKGFKRCLKPEQIECLKNNILSITGRLCRVTTYRDITVDDSKKNQWLVKHPYCAVYEDWEKWSHYICGKLNIKFEVERKSCDFVLELVREIIPCDILVYVQAYKKACDIGIKLDLNKDRCKSEFKILVEEHKCDFSFNTYVELKKCNVTFDMIKKVYDCDLKLNINSEFKPVLVTDLNEYALDGINPLDLAPLSEINKTPSISVQEILDNYK